MVQDSGAAGRLSEQNTLLTHQVMRVERLVIASRTLKLLQASSLSTPFSMIASSFTSGVCVFSYGMTSQVGDTRLHACRFLKLELTI